MKKFFIPLVMSFFAIICRAEVVSIVTEPAGSNTQVQYNNNGEFGSDPDFTFNGSTVTASRASISTATIYGLTLTGGAGNGKIPVSNASGVLSLTDPSTISVGYSTFSITATSSTYATSAGSAITATSSTYATNATTATWVINGGGGGSSSPQIIGPNDAALARVQVATATITGGYGVLTFMDQGLWPYAEIPRVLVSPVLTSSGSAVVCYPYATKEYKTGISCSDNGSIPVSYMLIGPSPVISSTITLNPSGSEYVGNIPGAVNSTFAASAVGGSPSLVFKVSHTGGLNFKYSVTYIVSAMILVEYRTSTAGGWTTLDSFSSDFYAGDRDCGDITGIAGYAEIRITISDYPAFGDVMFSSFVFTPQ